MAGAPHRVVQCTRVQLNAGVLCLKVCCSLHSLIKKGLLRFYVCIFSFELIFLCPLWLKYHLMQIYPKSLPPIVTSPPPSCLTPLGALFSILDLHIWCSNTFQTKVIQNYSHYLPSSKQLFLLTLSLLTASFHPAPQVLGKRVIFGSSPFLLHSAS